ncbi:MAG: hypothetical protein COB04_13085 [Gammaproteobacteria bacterium]|nr:MAG: hypothetical protein COB04_13085 [Gammaproteobacteria bacterium]
MIDRNEHGQAGWSLALIVAVLFILTLFAGIERQDYKSYQLSAIRVFQPVESMSEAVYEYPIIVCYSLESGGNSQLDYTKACVSGGQQVEAVIRMPWWYGEPFSALN